MKKILNYILVILLAVSTNTAFSDLTSNGLVDKNTKTIKELKKEVQVNTSKIEKSEQELDDLQKELLVKKFFKVNLNLTQKSKLNKIIIDYRKKKELLNNEIILKSKNLEDNQNLKKELLLNEKNFYGKLIEYIDKEKYNEYIEYIKKNIIIINTKSELESNSASKEVIIQNKVDNIKDKIKKQNKLTENNTIVLINLKINKVLTLLTNKKKFINLSQEGKNKLFKNLISKIEKKLEILKKKTKKSQTLDIIINNKDKIINNIKLFQEKLIK